MPDNKILVSRPYYQGLGLGLETWWPRSWSRDLVAKVLVLVLRPGGQGLGLETWWPRSWSSAFFKGLDNKSGREYLRSPLLQQHILFSNTVDSDGARNLEVKSMVEVLYGGKFY